MKENEKKRRKIERRKGRILSTEIGTVSPKTGHLRDTVPHGPKPSAQAICKE